MRFDRIQNPIRFNPFGLGWRHLIYADRRIHLKSKTGWVCILHTNHAYSLVSFNIQIYVEIERRRFVSNRSQVVRCTFVKFKFFSKKYKSCIWFGFIAVTWKFWFLSLDPPKAKTRKNMIVGVLLSPSVCRALFFRFCSK